MHFLKRCLVFLLVASKQFCSPTTRNALNYRHRGKYLRNHVIRTTIAMTESDCAVYCLKDEECASVNYKTTGENLGLCELNNTTLSEACTYSENNQEFNNLQILQREPKKKPLPPKSCKDILTKSPQAASGLYDISIDSEVVTVYCEMVRHGGGFTFIPKSAVKKGTLPNLVPQLFLNQSEVLLYIQKKDGSQTFTLIRQLEAESHTPLVVLQNTNSDRARTYNPPLNAAAMLDYLYLSTSININGFLSNNMKVTYNHNTFPIRSYFAFFPNHLGQIPNGYHSNNLAYESQGVAVKWRKTGIISSEKIPSNFFFLTELHYGGGGCYTSSDRWFEANGTAIGLR